MNSAGHSGMDRDMRTCDVLVVGGGPGGIGAAVAAARNGARTLLVDAYGCLGGALTVMGTHPMMTFHNKAGRPLVGGLPQELVDRLVRRGASPGHIPDAITYNSTVTPFDVEALKGVLDDLAAEAGVAVLFHTTMVDAVVVDARIVNVVLANRGGLSRVAARVFIDATGDADLAARAGVACTLGRGDGTLQPLTMNFLLAHVDMARVRAYAHAHPEDFWFKDGAEAGLAALDRAPCVSLGGFRKAWNDARERGEVTIPRGDVLFFETATPGVVAVNSTRLQGLDPTDPWDLSRAEVLGRQQVRQVFGFLRRYAPGFENAALVATPAQVGVREGRHPEGRYRLEAADLVNATRFSDPILMGGYPIDIHATKPGAGDCTVHLPNDAAYQVPLRCLLPVGVDNLVLSGRAISATHEASAAIRVTPLAMGIGQAAGTLAALATDGSVGSVAYGALRARLLSQHALLPDEAL